MFPLFPFAPIPVMVGYVVINNPLPETVSRGIGSGLLVLFVYVFYVQQITEQTFDLSA